MHDRSLPQRLPAKHLVEISASKPSARLLSPSILTASQSTRPRASRQIRQNTRLALRTPSGGSARGSGRPERSRPPRVLPGPLTWPALWPSACWLLRPNAPVITRHQWFINHSSGTEPNYQAQGQLWMCLRFRNVTQRTNKVTPELRNDSQVAEQSRVTAPVPPERPAA